MWSMKKENIEIMEDPEWIVLKYNVPLNVKYDYECNVEVSKLISRARECIIQPVHG